MPRLLVILLSALCFSVLGIVGQAEACQCSPPGPGAARDDASFIFEGLVAADAARIDVPALRRVTFRDVIVHRGGAVGAAGLTIDNGTDCPPVEFKVGSRYLIYLRSAPSEQGAALTVCDRVVESLSAGPELVYLKRSDADDAPSAPAASPAPTNAPAIAPGNAGGCASCSAVGAGAPALTPGALATVLIALGVALRRRASR